MAIRGADMSARDIMFAHWKNMICITIFNCAYYIQIAPVGNCGQPKNS